MCIRDRGIDWKKADPKVKFEQFLRTIFALNELYLKGFVTAPGGKIEALKPEIIEKEFPSLVKDYGDPAEWAKSIDLGSVV